MFSTPEYIQAEVAYRTEQARRSHPVRRRRHPLARWSWRRPAA